MRTKKQNTKGYTLLFSIIVSTVVLAIAAFILTISRKEFILASAARDSTVSIYAADSGIECAVEAFNNNSLLPSNPTPTLTCNGTTLSMSYSPGNQTGMSFQGTPQQSNTLMFNIADSCTLIVVTDGTASDGSHLTVIDSRGYNVNCTSSVNPPAPVPGPRNEERAIRIVYHT